MFTSLKSIRKLYFSFGIFLFGIFTLSSYQSAYSQEIHDYSYEDNHLPPLDPLYTDLIPPFDDTFDSKNLGKNNVVAVIKTQTSVKSQGKRGTCSIFSSIAILEARLKKKYGLEEIDLSEQFLEYVVVKGKTSDGSSSYYNFNALSNYGVPYEETLPYDPQNWTKFPELGSHRCGHIDSSSDRYKSCLIVHRDPETFLKEDDVLLDDNHPNFDPQFVLARTEALEFKGKYLNFYHKSYRLYSVSQIKKLLELGVELTMGIKMFYGAWNHGAATDEGVIPNKVAWEDGVVGYPEKGSIDYIQSPKKPAGHSVVIVGYDDEREVSTEVLMEDGTKRTFTYKGVYYFKNSWGVNSFGKNLMIDGIRFPGYGMITQAYAHQYGSFYQLPL